MGFNCEHCDFHSDENKEEIACPSCGIVLQEIEIDEKIEFAEMTSRKFRRFTYQNSKKSPQGLSLGLKMIKTLTSLYHVTSEMSEKATIIFQEAHASKYCHTIDDNRTLAGCCFYIILRENKFPVLITDLCRQIQCRIQRFNAIYKKIRCSTNIEIAPQEPQDLVENVLNGLPEEGKQQLIEKTKSLVALCQSCWLSSGRAPKALIIASAFVCWKSIIKQSSYEKLTFTKFCSNNNFSISQGKPILQEIQNLLLKLASNISSPSNSVANKQNVFNFLDYILSHSESLRNDMLSGQHNDEAIQQSEFRAFRNSPKKRQRHSDNEESAVKGGVYAFDVDISDSEISQYIRTKEEVATIEEIKTIKIHQS